MELQPALQILQELLHLRRSQRYIRRENVAEVTHKGAMVAGNKKRWQEGREQHPRLQSHTE